MSPTTGSRRFLVTLSMLTTVLLAGCAGMSAMESGYVLGSIAGGAAAGPAGAALGSAVGSLAGALVSKPIEQHREKEERKQLQAQLAGAPPAASPDGAAAAAQPAAIEVPTVMARVWVDEHLERGRVVPGRFEERRIPQSYVAAPPRTLDVARAL